MKKLLQLTFIAAFFATITHTVNAQNGPAKQWDKTLGGNLEDELRSLQQTSDGGYIVGGYSSSSIVSDKSQDHKGGSDYWIIKLDANGNKIWDKVFGTLGVEKFTSLQQTSDGGYILGGSSATPMIDGDKTQAGWGNYDFWIIKIDANGNKLWDKSFGGSGSDQLNTLQQTLDGGYILGGTSDSGISGVKSQASKGGQDYWIVKTDANGNKLWDKTLGGNGYDQLNSIKQNSDGGYILAGSSNSNIGYDKSEPFTQGKIWVLRLDATGTKIWDKTFGSAGNDYGAAAQQTTDGGFVVGGYVTYPVFDDYYILKLTSSGAVTWSYHYGGTVNDQLRTLQQTSDGGYILGGSSISPIGRDKTQGIIGTASSTNFDIWIVKLNADGTKAWDRTLGGTDTDNLYDLRQTSDGGYIIGGSSKSLSSSDKTEDVKGWVDYWVIKLAPNCTDLTAALTPTCGSNGTNLTANISGLMSTTTGTPSWTLNYTVNGAPQTATGSTSSFVLATNSNVNTNYALTSISAGSCTINLTNSFSIQAIPGVPNVVNGSNCGAGAVTLTATGAPTGGNYIWYNAASGGTAVHSSSNGVFTTPVLNTTTTYYVAAANNAGCEGPRIPVTATIKTVPVVTVGSSQTICAIANPIQLSGFSPAGGIWSGNGVNASGLFTPTNNLTGNQTLTYTVTQNGCSASATQNITVTAPPVVNAGTNQTICANVAPVQLSGFSPAGGTWSGSGVNASGVFTPGNNLVGNNTLTYTVTQNGCSVSSTKQVTVPAAIAQPTITLISPDTLISSVTGSSYVWKLNNATLPTTSRKLKATASGNYSVQVKDANNCASVFSADYSFIISGLKEMENAEVRIYPNPTNGKLNLQFSQPLNAEVKVYNALGQCILSKAISKQEKEANLDLTNAAKGIYTIQVIGENQSLIKKVVVE